MKKIGIKLADGSFYPIISEGEPDKTTIELTTANDGQTTVMVDLYRSETDSMEGAEFVDTLQLDSLAAKPNGTNTLVLELNIDENNELSATMSDKESGTTSTSHTSLPELDKKNNDATAAALSTDFGNLSDFNDEPADEKIEDFSFEDLSNFSEEPSTEKAETDNNAIAESDSTIEPESNELEAFSFDDLPDFNEEPEVSDDATAAALSTDFGDLPDFSEESEPAIEVNAADDDITDEPASDTQDSFSLGDLPDFNEEPEVSDDATAAALSTDFGDLPDFSEESEPAIEVNTTDDDITDEPASDTQDSFSLGDLPDFNEEPEVSDDATAAALSTDFGDLPDFSEESEPAIEFNTTDDDITDEPASNTQDSFSLGDLPDFNEEPEVSDDATAAALSTDFGDLPDFSEEAATDKQDNFSLDDLPDFSEEATSTPALDEENFSDLDIGNDINVNNSFAASSSLDNFNFADDLPDFNVSDSKKDDKFDLSDLPDFDTSDITGDDDFDLTDLPDFSVSNTKKKDNLSFTDFPDFDDDSTTDSSSSFNFDGLYDQETLDGKASYTDDTFEPAPKKKTKAPMIICIICAIICIIGTILVLFVVPSRFNLIPSRNTRNIAMQSQLQNTPTSQIGITQATSTQQPLLSERVIVEQLPPEYENIIPSPPPPPSPKPQDIVYKVKRGDTLWDISSAYYRNPWRYKMIAQYNNIKNPDYIVSGQTLKLPAE